MVERLKPVAAWVRAHASVVFFILLGVAVSLWLLDHDARLKQKLDLQQQRRETTAEVAQLRARAETAMKEFRANAEMIRGLESRRQALERDAAALRQKLSSLRKEENFRVQQLASLAHVGTPRQTAPGLDPADFGTRAMKEKLEIGNWKLVVRVSSFQFRVSQRRVPSPQPRVPNWLPATSSPRFRTS
jgi:hypothetical protein